MAIPVVAGLWLLLCVFSASAVASSSAVSSSTLPSQIVAINNSSRYVSLVLDDSCAAAKLFHISEPDSPEFRTDWANVPRICGGETLCHLQIVASPIITSVCNFVVGGIIINTETAEVTLDPEVPFHPVEEQQYSLTSERCGHHGQDLCLQLNRAEVQLTLEQKICLEQMQMGPPAEELEKLDKILDEAALTGQPPKIEGGFMITPEMMGIKDEL